MNRLANGGARYNSDAWFERTSLLAFLVGFAGAAAIEFARRPPHLALGSLSVAAVAITAYGLLTVQRRTYLFSPSTGIMTWISRGLFARDGGEVAFKDIGITVAAGFGTPIQYDVLLTTPTLRAYLWRSLRGDYESAFQEATALRALLGQSVDTLVYDSVVQMLRDGNMLGAKCFARQVGASWRSPRPSGAPAPLR